MNNRSIIFLFIMMATIMSFVRYEYDRWVTIQSNKFGFIIDFPKKPHESTQMVNTEVEELVMNFFTYNTPGNIKDENLTYLVIHSEYPDSFIPEDNNIELLNEFFKNAVNGAVTTAKGNLISEKIIHIDGYPGREIKIEFQDDKNTTAVINMRMYLYKNKMFIIETIAKKEKDGNKSSSRFMNSFKIINGQ